MKNKNSGTKKSARSQGSATKYASARKNSAMSGGMTGKSAKRSQRGR